MPVARTRYVNATQLSRVSAAFDALGFLPVRPELEAIGAGQYTANIESQYAGSLTAAEANAIVCWGLSFPLEYFASIREGEYSVEEIAGQYGE